MHNSSEKLLQTSISSCASCPWCHERLYALYGIPDYYCNKLVNEREIYNRELIPLWCPLPDVPESFSDDPVGE